MDVENVKLTVPGLSRTYTFFHISDGHVVTAKPDDSEEDRELAVRHTAKWNQGGIPPIDAFEDALRYVDSEEADALLIAGDCTDYYRPSIAEYMREKIAACNKEVLYVYGNHEGACYGKKVNYKDSFPEFAPVMFGNPSYWVKDYGELLIVGLDNTTKDITEEQFVFLEKQEARGLPILLLVHVPIVSDACIEAVKAHWGPDEFNRNYFIMGTDTTPESGLEFVKRVKSPDSHIVAIIAGHIHRAHEGEFAPGRMQFTSAPTFMQYIRKIEVSS